MTKLFVAFFAGIALISCTASKYLPKALTQGDPVNAESYGYQPIDPLPVIIGIDTGYGNVLLFNNSIKVSNERKMSSLPDETMRLAIGQTDLNGNVSFASAKIGYAGSSYIVILDYIKFDTKSLPVLLKKDSLNHIVDFRTTISLYTKPGSILPEPDAIIPVYVGVGLRFTATITVNDGTVDLGNLFALGIAAESKKVTGTLIIQTLGISGKGISSLIPMPSQINTTTIQNAIMSLAAIKAKIYEDDAEINPRVVGFYNNLGGGQSTVRKFIASVLSGGVQHIIKLNRLKPGLLYCCYFLL